MVHTPSALADTVMAQIGQGAEYGATPLVRRWSSFAGNFVTRPVLVAGVALVAVVLVVTQPSLQFWRSSAEPTVETDLIRQSLTNYQGLLSGGVKLQLASAEVGEVRKFFAGKTDFAVHVPAMKECTLLGCSIDDLGSEKVAHVLYRRNSGMIYVYQVCREMAMRGEQLSMSDDVRAELQRTGWFTQSLPGGDALVLWVHGGTLCAAVGRMDPAELVATLLSEEKREAW